MGERELSPFASRGGGARVLDGAVAPADLLWVFAGPVLRVVHDQIGTREKPPTWRRSSPQKIADAGGKRTRMRFVIARVDKGGAVGLKPVAQGERRMIEVAASNLDVLNPQPSPRRARAIARIVGAELLKGYGKVGWIASGRPEVRRKPWWRPRGP